MANGFVVDMDVMQQIVGDMNESIQKFDSYMKAASESMQALNTKWKGPANETFRVHFLMDYLMTESDIAWLRKTVNEVEKATNRYRTCEDEVHAEINHIQI